MRRIIIHLFFAFAAIFCCTTNANAQFLWHLEHTDYDGRYYYCFDAISCSGNNCTSCGSVIDTIAQTMTIMFWRSDDGGVTWNMQNPGLPVSRNLSNKPYFISIQQIDSLNIIAGGALGGYLLRTIDGGKTWQKDTSTTGIIWDIHFSDPMNGIVLSQGNFVFQGTTGPGEIVIYTTTDGGASWKTTSLHGFSPYVAGNLASCHSYGGGKFRVYKYSLGPVYTTYDNWQTVDSTNFLLDISKDPAYSNYEFTLCNFTGGDTLIAYGGYYRDSAHSGAILMRSTDAGAEWETPVTFQKNAGGIICMTSLDRDTVLAGCVNNKILMSTDRGTSWNADSLLLDTNYAASCNGIDWASNGHPVAIFTNLAEVYGIPSIIMRGEMMKSGVAEFTIPVFSHIYPNPSSTFINLASLDPLRPIHIIDIFGREVLRSATNEQGTQLIDISTLPRGIYDVLLDRNGRLLNAGKIAVTGK